MPLEETSGEKLCQGKTSACCCLKIKDEQLNSSKSNGYRYFSTEEC